MKLKTALFVTAILTMVLATPGFASGPGAAASSFHYWLTETLVPNQFVFTTDYLPAGQMAFMITEVTNTYGGPSNQFDLSPTGVLTGIEIEGALFNCSGFSLTLALYLGNEDAGKYDKEIFHVVIPPYTVMNFNDMVDEIGYLEMVEAISNSKASNETATLVFASNHNIRSVIIADLAIKKHYTAF